MRLKNVFCIGMLALCLVGCGQHRNNATVRVNTGSALQPKEEAVEEVLEEEAEAENVTSDRLYIVEKLDMTNETITVYSVDDHKNENFHYNLSTRFLDKFGNSTNWANFSSGTVVNIGDTFSSSGALTCVQVSDDVWVFEDLTKFSIDSDRGVFTIADKNYRLNKTTKVYSDNSAILLNDISDKDELKVIGKDKDILSIEVTTGHGYIQLHNPELFYDSLMFIGSKIVVMINGSMKIEVPEGTYPITIANDGWGGTAEFTVLRNETIDVDLDSMKGDGPSYCELSFIVTVPGTFVYLDGALVDTDETSKVRYGAHKLLVSCDGYNSWNKTLVVNSESAVITLELEETTQASESTSTAGSATGTGDNVADNNSTSTSEATNQNQTTNASQESNEGTASAGSDYDYETDYLSTISDLLSSIMN